MFPSEKQEPRKPRKPRNLENQEKQKKQQKKTKDPWCDIFLKRKLYKDLKNNVPKCLTPKYTNTLWVKFEDRPNMCYIFEKVMVRGLQKQCSQVKTKKT